jgi:Tfp pilus assembly protein FimT
MPVCFKWNKKHSSEETKMTTDLTGIRGVGPSTAEIFTNNGIQSVKDLACASIAEIMAIPGFRQARAEQVIAAAKSLLNKAGGNQAEAVAKEKPGKKSKANKKKKDTRKDTKKSKANKKKDAKKSKSKNKSSKKSKPQKSKDTRKTKNKKPVNSKNTGKDKKKAKGKKPTKSKKAKSKKVKKNKARKAKK